MPEEIQQEVKTKEFYYLRLSTTVRGELEEVPCSKEELLEKIRPVRQIMNMARGK